MDSLARVVIVSALAVGAMTGAGWADHGQPDELLAELTAAMRNLIEPQFTAATGLEFSTFSCLVAGELGPGGTFDCDAVDQEGDRIRYTLAVDDEGTATVVLASQPAADLTEADRAVLEPPCRRFLEAFATADWSSLVAALHPTLRDAEGGDAIRARLEPTRRSLGEPVSVELVSYAHHASGRHELEYALACANGPAVARFGLLEDGDVLRVSAFAIRPTPGSKLAAELLAKESRDGVESMVGSGVSRVEAPFEELRSVGDAVDGTAWLADGSDLVIRIVQHGRTDDFELDDFTIQMLDVPWMIRRAFAERPDQATTVDCPGRVAPDGGSLTCSLALASGKRVAVTVARRGGDHRIVAVEPLP
jgi:hypothetical protein